MCWWTEFQQRCITISLMLISVAMVISYFGNIFKHRHNDDANFKATLQIILGCNQKSSHDAQKCYFCSELHKKANWQYPTPTYELDLSQNEPAHSTYTNFFFIFVTNT